MRDDRLVGDALTPLRAALGPYVERFAFAPPAAGGEIVAASRYLDPNHLRGEIARAGAREGADDPLLGAAVWHVAYEVTVIAAAVAALAAGVVLDLAVEQTRLLLRDGLPHTVLLAGVPVLAVCPERFEPLSGMAAPKGWPHVGADEARRAWYGAVVRRNFTPVFEQVRRLTRLSTNVMWGNVASTAANVVDRLAGSVAAHAAAEDRRALLEEDATPDGDERGPLARRLQSVATRDPRLSPQIRARRVCCLYYLLPSERGMCATCPRLSTEEREARALARLVTG